MMAAWFNKDVIFARIPKTAGTSIAATLGEMQLWGASNFDRPSFTVVRNPYDRMRSCIAMMRRHTLWLDIPEADDLDAHMVIEWVKDPSRTLQAEDGYSFVKRHALPQSDPKFRTKDVDRVFKFETLAADWPALMEHCKLDPLTEMPHIRPAKMQYVLDADERAAVAECFAADFEAFGYSKDENANV